MDPSFLRKKFKDRMDPKFLFLKTGSTSPCFEAKNKKKYLSQWEPVLEALVHGWWCCDVPPRPTPFPLPSKPRRFWAFTPCQGWGRVGAGAGLVLGMITPPLPPFPKRLFFSGRHLGKGGKRGPYDARSSPPPPPKRHARSWRGMAFLDGAAGEEAGTGYQLPPYHPQT